MKRLSLITVAALWAVSVGMAQAPAAAPPAAPAAITTNDLKSVDTPKPEVRLKGDPDGGLTGNVSDIPVSDAKKGLTLADSLNQIGQNKVAINFVWTLVTGFLVMFMQAGFAIVETGLVPRQERQPHHDDELHGVRRRHAGLLAHRFRHPDGRCGRCGKPRAAPRR